MIFHRDIRQGDALFGLGSLADIRQVQIILRRNGPAESENRETKSKWLKRECFHNLGDYPSQIFGTLLPDNYKIFLCAFELIDPDMLRGAVLVRATGL